MTVSGQVPPLLEKTIMQISNGTLFQKMDIEALPPDKGAYLLIIEITRTFELTITTLPSTNIFPGLYIYCGSARGPGGIRARLKHHFANNKRPHWHVDHLSLQATNLWALAICGGDECQLRTRLGQSQQFIVPVDGFGASDCQNCPSHLLQWNPNYR